MDNDDDKNNTKEIDNNVELEDFKYDSLAIENKGKIIS